MTVRWLFLLALALPSAAWAAWVTPTAATCNRPMKSGNVCWWDSTSASTATDLLPLACPFASVHFDPQVAGTGTGAEVDIYRCTAASASTSSCEPVDVDRDGDGLGDALTLTGDSSVLRAGYQELQAAYIYAQPTANPSSHNWRVQVTCH
jgi:hypothetical protein